VRPRTAYCVGVASTSGRRLRLPSLTFILVGTLAIVVALWIAPTIAALVSAIDLSGIDHPYAIIGGFVVLDAVIPIFPSESLLTTASNLAAQSGSDIRIWRLIVAGSLGALIGDSLLYWLSRTVLRRTMSDRVEKASHNEKIARSMQVLDASAPLIIVFGRFVPGLRFMIGATMGLTKYPFGRFVLWNAIGGFFWAAYTCVFSYLVASVIEDKPLISIVASVVVTTAMLGLLYRPIRRHWDETAPPADEAGVVAVDPSPAP